MKWIVSLLAAALALSAQTAVSVRLNVTDTRNPPAVMYNFYGMDGGCPTVANSPDFGNMRRLNTSPAKTHTDSVTIGSTRCYRVTAVLGNRESPPSPTLEYTAGPVAPGGVTAEELLARMVPKAHPAAARTLIVVNDVTAPEAGTEGKGASLWVGETYARARMIPAANICHISPRASCCPENAYYGDADQLTLEQTTTWVLNPIRACLKPDTEYVQLAFGVPTKVAVGVKGASMDLIIAALRFNSTAQRTNPLRAGSDPRVLKVTRLDGPSAILAAALVARAIEAERMPRLEGTAYIDGRGIWNASPCDAYCTADKSFDQAATIAAAKFGAARVVYENTAALLTSCPQAAYYWGWYRLGDAYPDACGFTSGAIGAHFASDTAYYGVRNGEIPNCTANCRRNWVPHFLRKGITATWGATDEPFTNGFAAGDIVLSQMAGGAIFADAMYKALPFIGAGFMTIVGDGGFRWPAI